MSSKNNLVALGSAAVIAVYAAGFERTKAAAAQFASDDVRRPPPPAPSIAPVPIGAPEPRVEPVNPPSPVAPKRATPQAAKPVARESLPAVTTPPVAAPTAPTPVRDSTPVVVAAPPVTPPPAPPRDTANTALPPKTDSTAQTDKEKVVGWKDGLYFGWGKSRHGDIQAGVEIKAGRIASAFISECLTQYSCSWIAALPPQVVSRQSAEVDFVSGATQSANAFYTAVVEALKKAK